MKVKVDWDKHWDKNLKKSLFSRLSSMYRFLLLTREVKHYTTIYFPKKGIFVECGSGTGESSSKIKKNGRTLIALDISTFPLKKARELRVYHYYVQGDIFNLPFPDNSIDGIWNLGVMEHFSEDEIVVILKNFRRVLKDNSVCILFWPWRLGPAHLIIEFLEKMISIIKRRKIHLFPEEYTLFNKKKVEKLLIKAGFRNWKFHLSPYGGFIHWVVVCWK